MKPLDVKDVIVVIPVVVGRSSPDPDLETQKDDDMIYLKEMAYTVLAILAAICIGIAVGEVLGWLGVLV